MANGDAAEVGTIGNEGVVGLPLVFGNNRAPTSVYIQVPGAGLRMKATLFKEELARSASIRKVMFRYAHASSTRSRSPPRAITFIQYSNDVVVGCS